jgi:hypothetical protein
MNWSHLRRLSIVMRALEDAMLEIETSLDPDARAANRVMTVYEDGISESAKGEVRTRLDAIRAEIRATKDRYDLLAETISNRRRFSTKLFILAIDLTECRPQYLRAYGDVPDEEKAALNDRISKLETLISDLNNLIRPAPPG